MLLGAKELHENEEGTGEKPRCRKMQGQNVKGTGRTKRERNVNNGVFKEMQKEVKGHARKLSGKTCRGSEVKFRGKGREGWPAVLRQRVNPATPPGAACRR